MRTCRYHGGSEKAFANGRKAWRRELRWNGREFAYVNKLVGDGKSRQRQRASDRAKLAAKREAIKKRLDPKSVADWDARAAEYDREQSGGMTDMEKEFRSGRRRY